MKQNSNQSIFVEGENNSDFIFGTVNVLKQNFSHQLFSQRLVFLSMAFRIGIYYTSRGLENKMHLKTFSTIFCVVCCVKTVNK